MDFDEQKAVILDLFNNLMEGLTGDGIRDPSIDVDLGTGEARVSWTPAQPGADAYEDGIRSTAKRLFHQITGEDPTDAELEMVAAELRAAGRSAW